MTRPGHDRWARRTATSVAVALVLAVPLVAGAPALAAPTAPAPNPVPPSAEASRPPTAGASTEAELDLTVEEQQRLVDEVAALEAAMVELDHRIAASAAEVATAEAHLAEAAAQLEAAERADLEAAVALATQRARLEAEAVAMYVRGPSMPSREWSAEPAAVLRDQTAQVYGQAVMDQQHLVVGAYRSAAAEATTASTRARSVRDQQQLQRDRVQAELAQLTTLRSQADATRGEQTVLLADVAARRAALELRFATETASSDSVTELLQRAQAGQELRLPTPGSLAWPMGRPTALTSPYGNRMHPILGEARLHKGADFGCTPGERIVAAAAGTVVTASEQGGYGLAVVLDHGGRFATLSAHSSELLVATGQQVQAGDPIARCGSTGLSTGPHLHFEVRIEGVPVDPASYLPTR